MKKIFVSGLVCIIIFLIIISITGSSTNIVITKAAHLDENRAFISDIYEETSALDGIWSEPIHDNEYIGVTFEQELSNKNDITIYPRIISGNPRIEVYEKNGEEIIAEFTSLNDNKYNKVFLTNLQRSQDTFDLKILDGSVEFDLIIDPQTTVEIGTWTDTVGTFDWTPTAETWTGFPFDNEASPSSYFTQNADDIHVQVNEDGHYLVLYTTRGTTDYDNRLAWEGRVSVNDAGVDGTYSSGYSRMTEDADWVLSGGGILSVSAGDNISVEINYRGTNGDQIATSVADDSSFQIIKLGDDWDYARYTKSSDQALSMTSGVISWVNLTWDGTKLEEDTGYTLEADDYTITLAEGGHYLVITGASAYENVRASFETKTFIDNVELPVARSYAYVRASGGV